MILVDYFSTRTRIRIIHTDPDSGGQNYADLWGKYVCPLDISLIFMKKMHDISMILVYFC